MKTCDRCLVDDGDGAENYVTTVRLCPLHAEAEPLAGALSALVVEIVRTGGGPVDPRGPEIRRARAILDKLPTPGGE